MLHEHGYHAYMLNRTLVAEENAYGVTNSTAKYPVLCYCLNYGVCGCDDFDGGDRSNLTNSSVSTSTAGGRSDFKWNTTYALINGTGYSLLNGTLANGTTTPGGNENTGTPLGKGSLRLGWATILVVGTYFLVI
jgi:hypothetical protein